MKYLLFILLCVILPLEIIVTILSLSMYTICVDELNNEYFSKTIINLIKEYK